MRALIRALPTHAGLIAAGTADTLITLEKRTWNLSQLELVLFAVSALSFTAMVLLLRKPSQPPCPARKIYELVVSCVECEMSKLVPSHEDARNAGLPEWRVGMNGSTAVIVLMSPSGVRQYEICPQGSVTARVDSSLHKSDAFLQPLTPYELAVLHDTFACYTRSK